MRELGLVLREEKIEELIFIQSDKIAKDICIENPEDSYKDVLIGELSYEGESKKKRLTVYLKEKTKLNKPNKHFKKNEFLIDINFNGMIDFSENTDLSEMFYKCGKLECIDFGEASFLNLEKAEGMFEQCVNLKTIKGLDFNCPKLTNLYCAFASCKKLKELSFPKANLKSLETTKEMFQNCYSLQKVEILNTIIDKITDMERMFYDCKKLKEVNIKFNYSRLKNAGQMYSKCSSLIHFDFENFNPESLNHINMMFAYCYSLEGEAVFPEMTYYGDQMEEVFFKCEKIKKIDMSKVYLKNVESMNNFAEDCYGVESIEMGTLDNHRVSMNSFAYNCKSLKYLDLSQIAGEGISNAVYLATHCVELKVVRLGSAFESIALCTYMFQNCQNLLVIDAPTTKDETTKCYGEQIFQNCLKLKALSISNLNLKYREIEFDPKEACFPTGIKILYASEKDVDEKFLEDFELLSLKNTIIVTK